MSRILVRVLDEHAEAGAGAGIGAPDGVSREPLEAPVWRRETELDPEDDQ